MKLSSDSGCNRPPQWNNKTGQHIVNQVGDMVCNARNFRWDSPCNQHDEHYAPGLLAYLQRQSCKRFLLMDKQLWNEMRKHQTGEFKVEVIEFPMAEICRLTKVASIAKKIENDVYEIKIYREDLEVPKPINLDTTV